MQIRSLFLIYLPFATLMAIVFIIEINRRLKRREDYQFILLCFCVISWFICNLLMLITNDPQKISYLYHIKIAFVGFSPVFLLTFMMKFYRVYDKIPKYLVTLMLVIPLLTTAVCLTGFNHNLLVTQFDFVSIAVVRNFTITWGPWFWVHTAYSYILMMATIIINLRHHFLEPRFYRTPSSFMVAGVTLTFVSNIIIITHLIPSFLDTTVIGVGLSLFLYNIAIISNDKSRYARYTQRQILHFLDELIFVLDNNKRIVDLNQPAIRFFNDLGITRLSSGLKSITDALVLKGKQVDNDYYIEDGPFLIVLNLRLHDLTDENGETIGIIAVFTDVTQNRMLIERLEATAKIDVLTGLPNRGAYEGAKNRLDNPEHLPLAVIVGDVNKLKIVNDTLGHQYGDMMLQRIADILDNTRPKNSFLARIGGDEFIYLVPQCSLADAEIMITEIKDKLDQSTGMPFDLSVSLGCAVKESPERDLDEVIALADSLMYKDKDLFKASLG